MENVDRRENIFSSCFHTVVFQMRMDYRLFHLLIPLALIFHSFTSVEIKRSIIFSFSCLTLLGDKNKIIIKWYTCCSVHAG